MIDLAIDSRIFIESAIEEAVQELDLIFNTVNCELIGYPTYGTDFEQFLWNLNPNPMEVERYIKDRIFSDSYFLKDMDVDIQVELHQGNYRNIYLVQITINDDYDNSERRIYEFK